MQAWMTFLLSLPAGVLLDIASPKLPVTARKNDARWVSYDLDMTVGWTAW
jgi:hypothetical protein